MEARASSKVRDNFVPANARIIAKALMESFCIRHTNILGERRDYVKDMYFYALKFDGEEIPTDSVILQDLEDKFHTTPETFEYYYLKMTKDGEIIVYWKETIEPINNIVLSKFKDFDDFKSKFRGEIDEDVLLEYWKKGRNEEELINNKIKEIEDALKKSVEKVPHDKIKISRKKPKLTIKPKSTFEPYVEQPS